MYLFIILISCLYYVAVCDKAIDTTDNCQKCGKNELFSQCPSACPRTCKDYDSDMACIAMCMAPGCVCKPGYVLDECNKCILIDDCPKPKCGDNEEYQRCPSRCPKTCVNKDVEISCVAGCAEDKCVCKQGYVRDKDNVCILECDCPPRCPGQNEEYNACPTLCTRTCENLGALIKCAAGCSNDTCVCKQGYVRNKDNVCILEAECPPKCYGPNEEYNACPTLCTRTCDNKDIKINCLAGCSNETCVCKQGYVRNKDNVCILESECPPKCHGPNEEYNECPTLCPRTCRNRKYQIRCIGGCADNKCVCQEGYVRNDDNICILETECPCDEDESN